MSPPTDAAIPLAYPPMSDQVFFSFDGFGEDYFFGTAAPPPLAADPTGDYTNGGSIAAPLPSGVTVTAVATSDSSSAWTAAPPPPSPALPVAQHGNRTSCYRGVTRHRWTGRYEAHLWDNTCRREGQKRKGRQVYLGGYEKEDRAARAYDLAALKYWGANATTNFPKESYIKEIREMQNMSKHELVASLRRKSSGFSRGASIYRGVTRHHQQGRWQARIGRVAGNKDLYLGTFATEEEAAEAYDIAALKFRGENAVTNFEPSRYNLEAIAQKDIPGCRQVARRLNNYIVKPEAQGQITLANPPFSQQSSNNYLPPFLHNLVHRQQYYAPYSFGAGQPNFYWPFGNLEQKVQIDSKIQMAAGGIIQLSNSATPY